MKYILILLLLPFFAAQANESDDIRKRLNLPEGVEIKLEQKKIDTTGTILTKSSLEEFDITEYINKTLIPYLKYEGKNKLKTAISESIIKLLETTHYGVMSDSRRFLDKKGNTLCAKVITRSKSIIFNQECIAGYIHFELHSLILSQTLMAYTRLSSEEIEQLSLALHFFWFYNVSLFKSPDYVQQGKDAPFRSPENIEYHIKIRIHYAKTILIPPAFRKGLKIRKMGKKMITYNQYENTVLKLNILTRIPMQMVVAVLNGQRKIKDDLYDVIRRVQKSTLIGTENEESAKLKENGGFEIKYLKGSNISARVPDIYRYVDLILYPIIRKTLPSK